MGGRTHGKDTAQVLLEIKNVHGESLLYDRFIYKNSKTKVTVGCKIHDYYFEKWPNDLKHGSGCPKCAGNHKKTHDEFVKEIQTRFPNIIVVEKYKNAKQKLQLRCSTHLLDFFSSPNQLLSGHVNCPECVVVKSINTKLKQSKSVIDPATKSDYEKYRREVWRFSNRNYRKYMTEQIRDRHNHLDHIVSILHGYQNNIDPRIIGSIHNLRIIDHVANRKKSYNSDMTIDELLGKYYA